jgi:hypothetical protein
MGGVMTRIRTATAGIRDSGFASWARNRPFVGGVLAVLAGIEMFFSGQLDIGNIHVQLGIEGFQATIIPVGMVLLGVLCVLMPAHRIFYGVLTLVVAVYSLIGVNLGGFFVGMLLGAVGGILIVAWMPKKEESNGRALPLVQSRS